MAEHEKEASYDVLDLHKYKVKLISGERVIAFPYIKTSAILKIFMGTSGEFRELVKSIFSKESVSGGSLDFNKLDILHKALDMLNKQFASNLVDAFTEAVNCALNEYDENAVLVVAGNSGPMHPEDINTVFRVIIADLGEVLKNVFGMEVTKPKKKSVVRPSLKTVTLIKETAEAL